MASDTFIFIAANNADYSTGYSFTVALPYVIVEAGALVTLGGTSGDALALAGGGYDLTVRGSLVGNGGSGAALFLDGAGLGSAVTISSTGVVKDGNAGIRAGNALILNNAGLVSGLVYAFAGNTGGDLDLNNSGTMSGATFGISLLGSGKTVFRNSGTVTANTAYSSLDGVDDITNDETGVINGFVSTGGSDDVLTNNSTINTRLITLGDGDDTFTNNGVTTDFVAIFMGAGDDVLASGSGRDRAVDEDGADQYDLGAGSDIFSAHSEGPQTGTDIVRAGANDGFGAGFIYGDTYEAADGLNDVRINIGFRDYGELAGRTAAGTDVGLDQIYGFESAYSGEGNDILAGNARQNYLSSLGGSDELAGRAGDDVLDGGEGDDLLIGGRGADALSGNLGADVYEFDRASDSTVALKGRDLVQGFDDGQDRMNFAFLDDTFDFVGKDAAFSGDGHAEIKASETVDGWLIRVDANGDGHADAAVSVLDAGHLVVWDAGDFLLVV